MKKHTYLLYLFLGESYLLFCIPEAAYARYPKTKRYPTTQAYILDNFQCSVEFGTGIPFFKLLDRNRFYYPINAGIVMGYYLDKYHYKPSPKSKLKETRHFVYDPSKNLYIEMCSIEPGKPREGEASTVLQIGLKYPFQERAEPAAFDHFQIIEKFLSFPISIKWTVPITLWKQNIFHSTALGLNIKYLLSSTYIPEPNATELPAGVPPIILDLKQYLKDLSLFSCSAFFEYGFVLPIGISINLIVSCPLEFVMYRRVKQKFPQERGYLSKDYIWKTRCFYFDNILVVNVGLDCFMLFKEFKKHRKRL